MMMKQNSGYTNMATTTPPGQTQKITKDDHDLDRMQIRLMCECNARKSRTGEVFHETGCPAIDLALEIVNDRLTSMGFEIDYGR
jgi:hypothetical protein